MKYNWDLIHTGVDFATGLLLDQQEVGWPAMIGGPAVASHDGRAMALMARHNHAAFVTCVYQDGWQHPVAFLPFMNTLALSVALH